MVGMSYLHFLAGQVDSKVSNGHDELDAILLVAEGENARKSDIAWAYHSRNP